MPLAKNDFVNLMKKIFISVFIFLLLAGCGPSQSDYDGMLKYIAELEAQVAALNGELEDVKFGSGRLLAQAKSAYETGSDTEAKRLLSDLLRRHPSSPESIEATSLLSKVDERIKAAEIKRNREKDQERLALEKAIASMKKVTDEIDGITWVSHRDAPLLGNYASIYFGVKNESSSNYPIRLKLQYNDDNWLFIHSVTVKADEKLFELGGLDFKRDTVVTSVREWIDIPVKDHEMLNQWMTAKRVLFRFNGDKYYHDFILPNEQQSQLREVYAAWKIMGGKR